MLPANTLAHASELLTGRATLVGVADEHLYRIDTTCPGREPLQGIHCGVRAHLVGAKQSHVIEVLEAYLLL